jgi:hypothetical protein
MRPIQPLVRLPHWHIDLYWLRQGASGKNLLWAHPTRVDRALRLRPELRSLDRRNAAGVSRFRSLARNFEDCRRPSWRVIFWRGFRFDRCAENTPSIKTVCAAQPMRVLFVLRKIFQRNISSRLGIGLERRPLYSNAQAPAIVSRREPGDSPENLPECALILVAYHPSNLRDCLH